MKHSCPSYCFHTGPFLWCQGNHGMRPWLKGTVTPSRNSKASMHFHGLWNCLDTCSHLEIKCALWEAVTFIRRGKTCKYSIPPPQASEWAGSSDTDIWMCQKERDSEEARSTAQFSPSEVGARHQLKPSSPVSFFLGTNPKWSHFQRNNAVLSGSCGKAQNKRRNWQPLAMTDIQTHARTETHAVLYSSKQYQQRSNAIAAVWVSQESTCGHMPKRNQMKNSWKHARSVLDCVWEPQHISEDVTTQFVSWKFNYQPRFHVLQAKSVHRPC